MLNIMLGFEKKDKFQGREMGVKIFFYIGRFKGVQVFEVTKVILRDRDFFRVIGRFIKQKYFFIFCGLLYIKGCQINL